MSAVTARAADPGPAAASAGADRARLRVAVIGATGYAGGELVRLLARHPAVELVALVGRDRGGEPIGSFHPHLDGTGLVVEDDPPDADAYFLALPHGAAAARVPDLARGGRLVVDLGPDFRLRDPADYPRWYGFEHPAPSLLGSAVYGLPELYRDELSGLVDAEVRIVGAPGCYPTATLLALAPLARAGLIGDLVVDAKSGVSGAGRDVRADLLFDEVNESVRAYGLGGHRHVAEIEQELAAIGRRAGLAAGANPGASVVDFVPHLIPMDRGILATCHVRPSRPIDQASLDALYAAAYDAETFVTVVGGGLGPTTKSVRGSNQARVRVVHDPRTDRIVALGAIDNLVKGAAGQAIQAFNLASGLPEATGLDQLPIAP